MGQGVNTKVQQVAATVLQIPITDILTGETSSSVISNTTESGGSFVADINGQAVKVRNVFMRRGDILSNLY
jgi:xanthine dehydrogenase molybdopterin-binding subunit B